MPRKDRKMVPVPTWLHDKLHGIADCWEEAYIGGKPVAVRSPDGSVPLWRVIADLIRRYEEHRERSRRSRRSRRKSTDDFQGDEGSQGPGTIPVDRGIPQE